MYTFSQVLHFLPQDYRRKLEFSVGLTFAAMMKEPEGWSDVHIAEVTHLYRDIQSRSMFLCELLGCTNTNGNPFELDTYPPTLIGG